MKRFLSILCLFLSQATTCWSADLTMTVDTSLSEVPVNNAPLLDNTDFKSIEGAVAYNAAGMALRWHFVKTNGTYTVASVTPTTGGLYDWTDQGDSGVYTIEMPISGGTTDAMNTEEGVGWFTGSATGILPWTGPTIQFLPANISNSLINGTDKLDVNAAEVNSVSTSGVTAVNANLGTTQPVNFQGTGGSAIVKCNNPFLVASGTATDGGATEIEWPAGSSTNDFYNGLMIVIFDASSNNRPHVATVTDWDASVQILTFSPAKSDSVANGDTFQILYVPREIKATYDSVTAGVTLANDAITATKVASDAGTELATANWASSTRTLSAATNITSSGGTITTSSGTVTVGTNNDKTGYSLSSGGIAGIWDAATSGMSAGGSIGKRIVENLNAVVGDLAPQSYFEALFEGAPTFADAMDSHGYFTERAEKIDRLAPNLLASSTIDDTSVTVTQTSFALEEGPTEDDVLNGAIVIVTDASDSSVKAIGLVKDYDGSTETVTLVTDPEIFSFADGDTVDVIATGSPAALWLGGSP